MREKLPVRLHSDGTDWVPAWRLTDYETAADVLQRLTDLFQPHRGITAALHFDGHGPLLDEARAALARLRGDA